MRQHSTDGNPTLNEHHQEPYTPILATLAYVLDAHHQSVLMIRRDSRPSDQHFGKLNGLGGKLHENEDIVAGVTRELYEEGGIVPTAMALAGTISWPGFGKAGESWFGFIFVVHTFSGAVRPESEEGSLLWIPVADVVNQPLWEGDRHFLPLVFADPLRTFHGVMPYRDGRPVSWTFSYL